MVSGVRVPEGGEAPCHHQVAGVNAMDRSRERAHHAAVMLGRQRVRPVRDPARSRHVELRPEEAVEVRLVPHLPSAHARNTRSRAAVALGRRLGERRELTRVRLPHARAPLIALHVLGPKRGTEDGDDRFESVVRSLDHEAVEVRPVICGVQRVGRIEPGRFLRASRRDARPVEPDPYRRSPARPR